GYFSGVDVRKEGSGNVGATNVARVAGKKPGLLTRIGDAAKAIIPVYTARWMGFDDKVMAGVTLIAFHGHLYPSVLKFVGGKVVATALGGLLAIAPEATAVLLVVL